MRPVLIDVPYFSRRVAEEIARSRRSGTVFSVVTFTSRPDPGDFAAVTCVESLPLILANVRATDTVCRTSDDTVAVLLIDADDEGSRAAALRLLDRIGDDLGRWEFRILDYPAHEALIAEIGFDEDAA
jgi:hypothetical protein